jgi:hypothetical protein
MIIASLKRFVYVPVKIAAGGRAFAELHWNQWLPLHSAGTLEVVGGKICTVAEWLGSHNDRHRVQFVDGQTAWLKTESPIWQEEQLKSA